MAERWSAFGLALICGVLAQSIAEGQFPRINQPMVVLPLFVIGGLLLAHYAGHDAP